MFYQIFWIRAAEEGTWIYLYEKCLQNYGNIVFFDTDSIVLVQGIVVVNDKHLDNLSFKH